ncbi:MAG: DNA replication protein DnaC [Gammaproteobacteria bacterium]|jgi:DNA replication protein DnaC
MLNHPTLDQLKEMKLSGMALAFEEQLQRADYNDLSFNERLGFLVEREHSVRANRQLTYRLRRAQLKLHASIEDLDQRVPRGLDKSFINELARSRFINDHLNVLITGPTGVGKTYLACAIAHSACRNGFSARYLRVPRLLTDLTIARGDGTWSKVLAQLAKTDLVILDDWGLATLDAEQRRDLLDILDDRHGLRSTVVTSQLPVKQWHEIIGDPTLADAILDRLVHNAYTINLKGESMRKKQANLTQADHSAQ